MNCIGLQLDCGLDFVTLHVKNSAENLIISPRRVALA